MLFAAHSVQFVINGIAAVRTSLSQGLRYQVNPLILGRFCLRWHVALTYFRSNKTIVRKSGCR